MAEEVGAAFVSLIPSARGFSKLAQRELKKELAGTALTIPVKPEFDQASMAGILGNATRLRVPVDLDVDRAQFTATLATVTERLTVNADVPALGLIGSARRAVAETQATNPTIRVHTSVDRPALGGLFGRDGEDAGREFSGGVNRGLGTALPGAVTGPFSAVANNPVVSTIAVGLGTAIGIGAVPAIGAAISAALIGGTGLGVIGLGAFILKDDPKVAEAATSLKEKFKSTFTNAAQPLVDPLVNAMSKIEQLLTDIGPDLKEMFTAIGPAIGPLTDGLVGFIKGAMPGILDLTEAAVPMLKDLASTLPRLGEDVGAFFGIIADSGPGASMFFRDLLNLVGLALTGFGYFVAFLTNQYMVIRTVIDGALEIFRQAALGWGFIIDGIIGYFKNLGAFIAGVWRVVKGDTDGTISFFKGIPGRLLGALGNTGNLLRQAGKNIVQGLIDGIKAMFGSLGNVASNIAGTIRNYLPFSPAKEGPLSGSGNPFNSGQSIGQMLAGGMESQLPTVSSASSQLAGAVAFGSRSGSAASGGITAGWKPGASGDQLLDALREMIAFRFGGDPDAALGGR